MRHQQAVLIRQRNEMTIEQPMHGCRQRDPVLYAIRSAALNRPDMRRLRLGPPAAVDQLPPGHRVARVVGVEHRAPERPVAKRGLPKIAR